jgi:hypothetical protein
MTFPTDVADHHKQDMRQKSFYILTLIKAKSQELYQKFHAQYEALKVEDSWDFYHMLVAEYKKLVDSADQSPAPKKEAPKKKEKAGVLEKAKAVLKKEVKAVAKKVVKKVTKAPAKKTAKKVTKKVAKKAAPKKAVKKAAVKKAAPKKTAKKAAKKPAAKKVAKKKKK